MKKQFFAISLLLATNAQTIDSLKMTGAVAGAAAVVGLAKSTQWANQIRETNGKENPVKVNSPSVFTTIGNPFGITGADMLKVFNGTAALTAIGCLAPDLFGSTIVTAGGTGAATLVIQTLFGKHDQNQNPVDVNTTIKWTFGGAVLGATYQRVPAINSLVNGVFGWNK